MEEEEGGAQPVQVRENFQSVLYYERLNISEMTYMQYS
jgi:hypothetical protein